MLITGHTHEVRRSARSLARGAFAGVALHAGAGADSRCVLRPQFKAYKYEDRLFINPVRAPLQDAGRAGSTRGVPRLTLRPVQGSATGAYSPLRATSKPSFVLMDVDGARVRHRFRSLAPCA